MYALGKVSGATVICKNSSYKSPTVNKNEVSVPLAPWGRVVFLVINESNVKVE